MGYCGIIRCSSCNYKFYVEGIEPQLYALPSVESAIDFFNSVITDTWDQTVGRTGILGFPIGPLRRLGWASLGLA